MLRLAEHLTCYEQTMQSGVNESPRGSLEGSDLSRISRLKRHLSRSEGGLVDAAFLRPADLLFLCTPRALEVNTEL